MSEESQTSKYLIDLIINQDHVAQGWIKFLLTIQSALAIAFWLLAGTAANLCKTVGGFELVALGVLIPIVAIIASYTITKIVVHERRWQAWYVQRFTQLTVSPNTIFPTKRGAIDGISDGYISKVLKRIRNIVIISWIVAGIAVVIFGSIIILLGHCPK